MEKVKIDWASHILYASGNALGYWTHDQNLKQEVAKIAEITRDAKNALFIVSPEFYNRNGNDGRIHFLFSMFEGQTLPEKYRIPIQKADFILVPSNWVKEMFSKYFEPDRIFVVNHGVSKDFTYKQRKYPKGKPFRYLWIGAPNPRKGWEEIINVWKYMFQKDDTSELYIKTTNISEVDIKGNVILDGRKLPLNELVRLYHSAHCFVLPHRGEGWGMTLSEAMATGLPCIATDYSGVKDFFDSEVGYPIGYTIGEGEVTFIKDKVKEDTKIAYPNLEELVESMIDVRVNYKKALLKGKKASLRMREKFTWEKSARKLVDIIREYGA